VPWKAGLVRHLVELKSNMSLLNPTIVSSTSALFSANISILKGGSYIVYLD
jgi:hypothetical protein